VLSQREQLCRSQSCSSVCHVSRKGCRFPSQRRCLCETAPGVTGLRTDGIILLADEDCSKDLLVDSFGCNPTLVSSLATSSNFLFDNVFAAECKVSTCHQPQLCHVHAHWIHCLWLFQQGTPCFVRPIR
jgi:hypothetical protein